MLAKDSRSEPPLDNKRRLLETVELSSLLDHACLSLYLHHSSPQGEVLLPDFVHPEGSLNNAHRS